MARVDRADPPEDRSVRQGPAGPLPRDS